MRPLPNHRNLPSLPLKHSTHRPLQHPQTTYQHQITSLAHAQQIIFNADAIPLSIDLHSDHFKEITVQVGFEGLIVKNRSQMVSLPWSLQREEWVHLTLGQSVKKVEAKTRQNENKMAPLSMYSSMLLWQKLEHSHGQTPYEYSVESTLAKLRSNPSLKQSNIHSKLQSSISTKLKIRNTERASSSTFKSKIASLREQELSISQWYKAREFMAKPTHSKRLQQQILAQACNNKSIYKRNSNTSTSVRSEGQKLHPRPTRFKDMISTKKVRAATYAEDCRKGTTDHYRPKFYEQAPITLEEIELKRKKFQSQFIAKKTGPVLETTAHKAIVTEESEVMEDICRAQQSNYLNGFEQTFDNGAQAVNGFVDAEQSGTLCQSVFQ